MGLAGAGLAVAAVGTAASIGGQIASSSGSKSQSGAISGGLQQGNQVLQPYVDTGTNALTRYADFSGINGPDAAKTAMDGFTASPGYNYQVEQGLRAVDAGAASKGLLRSGATLKAEQSLGSNLANQDFGNYLSRLNNLAGLGAQGAGQQSSNDTGAATQQASIYGNDAKNLSNTIGGIGGVAANGLAKYYGGNGLGSNGGSIYGDSSVSNNGLSYTTNSNPNANWDASYGGIV